MHFEGATHSRACGRQTPSPAAVATPCGPTATPRSVVTWPTRPTETPRLLGIGLLRSVRVSVRLAKAVASDRTRSRDGRLSAAWTAGTRRPVDRPRLAGPYCTDRDRRKGGALKLSRRGVACLGPRHALQQRLLEPEGAGPEGALGARRVAYVRPAAPQQQKRLGESTALSLMLCACLLRVC